MPVETTAPPAAPTAPAAPTPPATPGTTSSAAPPQPSVTPSTEPLPKTTPGSPMDEMFKRLDKMVEPKDETATASTTPEAPKTPEAKAEGETPTPAETPKNGDTPPVPDGKRPNPWKLMEEHKSARAKAEAENVRLQKLIQKPEEREAEVAKVKQLEEQNKQLLEHIRFVDYQKHPEFAEKYEKPYVENWNKIMRRLSGVTVDTGDGTRRPVEPKDIAEISRLPADQAIELAEQKFGKLGPWVAERVEELRGLDEAKHEALEKAKKDGLERQSQMTESQKIHEQKVNEFLGETWTKAVAEVETHSRYGEYFRPKEGDDEYNAKLESSTEKVNKFWGKNPKDPKLSPEEKAEIVRGHASIFNKARAFGTQNLTITRLKAENERLTKENAQFKSSVPATDGSQPPSNGTQPYDPWARLNSSLDRLAK